MKLYQKLQAELNKTPTGTYAPYYFTYLGYRKHLTSPISIMRAQGIYSLFAFSKPHIFESDLIVGNVRALYSEESDTVLNYAHKFVSGFGKVRFEEGRDHYTPNYEHTVEVGVCGLLDEIEDSLIRHQEDLERYELLQAMKITLQGFQKMIENYMFQAQKMSAYKGYDKERCEFIVKNCKVLLNGAPETFAQALQLVWFCHTAFLYEGRYAMALGRMDQYLYPFYQKDIKEGTISKEEVVELLENVFIKIDSKDVVNICIGGTDTEGNCQVNELSYCILEAVKNCNVPGPNLSARVAQNTPDAFLDECLKSIGTGLGYPALMNDEINIEALRKYGYEEEDLYNYSMVGCIENFITGKQPPWSDGRFDVPRFFDYVFFNGVSEFNGSVGLDLGNVEDIQSMEEFVKRFEEELAYGVAEHCANYYTKSTERDRKYFPQPFLSCFCYDCIARGLDINDGGSKYPSVYGAALMGVGTTSDSLAAIEKVVFVDQAATLTDIKNAIRANFEGYEDLRQKLLDAPKYGNNDDFVDKYAVWFLDYLSSEFWKYKTRDGGGIYVAMAANIQNISAGKCISATPDGRKAGEAISDAASPTYGRDKKGATVTLNSVTKPDYTKVACGSVVNQKFSPSIFRDENRGKLLALVKTYIKKGGQELQMNATSREVLLDAMVHPEKYQNLVVRVSGFSDYFVRLSKDVQFDILSRTQQE